MDLNQGIYVQILIYECSTNTHFAYQTNASLPLSSLVESVRSGLPAKNGLLTSSQGSVTTVADDESQEPQELGRVGGWIASFDKLLEDPLGVTCLQVCVWGRERGRERGRVSVCVHATLGE